MKKSDNKIKITTILDQEKNSFLKFTEPFLNKLLKLDKLNAIYQKELVGLQGTVFLEKAFELLNLDLRYSKKELERIPKTGPLVVTSNHPYGGLDGIVLLYLLLKVRPDIKIIANKMLSVFDELKEYFFFVDVFKAGASSKGLRDGLRHLKEGNAIAIFPAGEVSAFDLKKRRVSDVSWKVTAAKMIKKTEATTVPFYFSGKNSTFFQIAGLVHPLIRTVLLPREIMKLRRTIAMKVGLPIEYKDLKKYSTAEDLTDYLRLQSYVLKDQEEDEVQDDYEPLIEPISKERLKQDIDNLKEENFLLEYKDCKVYYASFEQIPNIIFEIGRLREFTFRTIDEGTGYSLDLDDFDKHYQHLFIWNEKECKIIGSYRFACVNETVEKYGKKGLYTNQFYRYPKNFLKKVDNGIELGRSFVDIEYQNSYHYILLLLKGIGHYVARNPHYRHLFGAVSVSKNYNTNSRYLISRIIEKGFLKIRTRKTYRPKINKNKDVEEYCKCYDFNDLQTLSKLVKDIEGGKKDLPPLLKQYLRIGGKFFAFATDPHFNNTLDGLIMVDFAKTPIKTLNLYMGEDSTSYRSRHEKGNI